MIRSILLAGLLTIVGIGSLGFAGLAYGAYMGNVGNDGTTGKYTIEEALELQRNRVISAQSDGAIGSGVPYLDASSVFGASTIAGAIFGGIAAAFLIKGRSGKYAAQGRG